jgi:hypothetical protein
VVNNVCVSPVCMQEHHQRQVHTAAVIGGGRPVRVYVPPRYPCGACSAALLLPHAASPTVRIIPSRRAEILVSRVQGRLSIPSPPLRRRIFGMANVRMGSRRRYGPRQPADFKGRPSVRHRPRFRSVRSCSDAGPSPRRCGLVVRRGPHPGTPPPTDLAIRPVVQSGPAKLLRSCRPSRPAARGP